MFAQSVFAAAALASAPAAVQDVPAWSQQSPQTLAQRAGPTGDGVAAVIDQEFPSYDKDRDGALSQDEFGAWMYALKVATDPTIKADAPAIRTWVNAAFAQADTDKSKSLTKGELTGFLSQGQS